MSPADASPAAAPHLALIGGRLEPDNVAVFETLRQRCSGRLAVMATASLIPEQIGPETVADFVAHGFAAELLPLFWGNHATAAFDPALVAKVHELGAVYFTGGDQSHLLEALAQGGQPTPVLAAIQAVVARGGLIAGSSAGAAVMSRHSILGGTSLEAVVHGVAPEREQPGLLLGQGLGFFTHGLVDQHFIQRGRVGRLLVAMAATGERYGFGVDENTCMFVDGTRITVLGEKGVLVVDATRANFDIARRRYDDFRVSYLDDGDTYDLTLHHVIPAAAKLPVKSGAKAFVGPGYIQRSVFGPNVFDELLTRLAEGDAERYARDQATAYEPDAQVEVALELERAGSRTGSLIARRNRAKRFTVIDYGLNVRCRPLSPEQRRDWMKRHTKQLMRGRKLANDAQLVAIGGALDESSAPLLRFLREGVKGPLTVVPAASASPRGVTEEYLTLMAKHGIAGTAWEPPALEEGVEPDAAYSPLATAPAILFTGGNQERLLQALFHQGDESPLLQAALAAYRSGGTLVAIGGSATALSPAMICGGTSEEALTFGISPDPWYRGVVLQEGLGIFRDGLLDQHFITRNRLGRLLVACVEEGHRFGFGLPEGSGLAATGGGHRVLAIGAEGFVCLDLRATHVEPAAHGFSATDVIVRWVRAGEAFDTASGGIAAVDAGAAPAPVSLTQIIDAFAAEAAGLVGPAGQRICRIENLRVDEAAAAASFAIHVERPADARKPIREIDHRGVAKRE